MRIARGSLPRSALTRQISSNASSADPSNPSARSRCGVVPPEWPAGMHTRARSQVLKLHLEPHNIEVVAIGGHEFFRVLAEPHLTKAMVCRERLDQLCSCWKVSSSANRSSTLASLLICDRVLSLIHSRRCCRCLDAAHVYGSEMYEQRRARAGGAVP
jgi:hypothetical protein